MNKNVKLRYKEKMIKNGILLIAIGLIFSAIPYLGSVLTILILIGFIYILIGYRNHSQAYAKIAKYAFVLFLVAIVLEIIGASHDLSLLFGLNSMSSISYGKIISFFDPFIFFVVLSYIFLGASMFMVLYPVFPKKSYVLLWIIFLITFLIILSIGYEQMSTLNTMYYQNLTLNNVGVLNSVVGNIEGSAALFNILWAIMFFLGYVFAKRKFSTLNYGNVSKGQVHQTNKCPNCGAENPIEAKHCMKCGMPLAPIFGGQGIRCPNCGSTNPPNVQNCIVCGYPLYNQNNLQGNIQTQNNSQGYFSSYSNQGTENQNNYITCPNCGYLNPPEATYCLKCGYRLK
jgi:ribosomal protein L40E